MMMMLMQCQRSCETDDVWEKVKEKRIQRKLPWDSTVTWCNIHVVDKGIDWNLCTKKIKKKENENTKEKQKKRN